MVSSLRGTLSGAALLALCCGCGSPAVPAAPVAKFCDLMQELQRSGGSAAGLEELSKSAPPAIQDDLEVIARYTGILPSGLPPEDAHEVHPGYPAEMRAAVAEVERTYRDLCEP